MMLTIENIYQFQLLQRGVPVYSNNQFVVGIVPIQYSYYSDKHWYLMVTQQEIVYCNPDKKLSLSVIENQIANDSKWS